MNVIMLVLSYLVGTLTEEQGFHRRSSAGLHGWEVAAALLEHLSGQMEGAPP